MDITIPEDLRIMRETIRRFVQTELEPITRQVEQQNEIPEEIVEQMKELGLFGLTIPEEHHGTRIQPRRRPSANRKPLQCTRSIPRPAWRSRTCSLP